MSRYMLTVGGGEVEVGLHSRPRRKKTVGGQCHVPASLPQIKKQAPIVQEAGWASGAFWIDVENVASTGVTTPDRPACSESLYLLSHPAP
jgi:hypothetical protein